ncbi:FAD-dependent monooxygenase [Natronobacterium texcoconense]|uniref:Electron transfer flavoprotein-quinone oxidoreductase n=1 Tax=Natronobacterium texcoconense TaxID=1095778 RepID=A0A1H1C2N1_NATTX|nr:FAD-dependent monooxygenase [Natronobacterium texcoconense]SDQ58507.1 electron transfer flavoprotein-quinone oxidoreductase [Natronobacterium texcoconense]
MSADSSDREHYEAVVVGCGPGGAAAAARLAEHNIETLVLERGTAAGSKNVSGGLIYAENSAPYTIDDLFDGFREAAAERPVTDYRIHNVAGNRVKTYDLTDLHEHDTDWCDAVLRRQMDSWLETRVHEKTSETGGGVLTNVRVNGLLREDGEIVGVTCDELDPIEADIVVAADGVNSELARDAGLMDWEEPEEWFQGVKAVVDMDPDVIDDRFDIGEDEGVAHLFSGDLFEDVRGGGFLYTNEDSLSIGTVFHLDSLVEQQAEPHQLLDALLTHPMMARWLGDEYEEREYAAKLVPDSKKVAHPEPYQDRLVLVGDAAGQMQAQGPIIKGMNHAVTAGALAADAFAVTRGNADPEAAGRRYARMLEESGTMDKLRPRRYELARTVGERDVVTNAVERVLESPVGSLALGNPIADRLLQRAFNSPFMLAMLPDTKTGYVTIPSIIGEEHGRTIQWETDIEPPSLEERIGDLTYDTDVGNPHIELQDESFESSGTAVYACPVSAEDFGGGCYRSEEVKRNGTEETVVSLDTQPCVECGTCAIVADTEWEHPRGGKGVEYREG